MVSAFVLGQGVVHRLQIHSDHPPGKPLHLPDRLLRGHLGQSLHHGLLYVEHIEEDKVRPLGGRKLGVGHVGQHGLDDANGLAGQNPALAPCHGGEKILPGQTGQLRGGHA